MPCGKRLWPVASYVFSARHRTYLAQRRTSKIMEWMLEWARRRTEFQNNWFGLVSHDSLQDLVFSIPSSPRQPLPRVSKRILRAEESLLKTLGENRKPEVRYMVSLLGIRSLTVLGHGFLKTYWIFWAILGLQKNWWESTETSHIVPFPQHTVFLIIYFLY